MGTPFLNCSNEVLRYTELVALFFILGQRAPEKREGATEEMRSRTGTLRDDKVSGFGGRLNEMTVMKGNSRFS